MAEHTDREHFIPVRRHELVDLLCADKGLSPEDRGAVRQLSRLVTAMYHFQYNDRLERLKQAYAPFDPDSDCTSLVKWTAEQRQQHLDDLFTEFEALMERANFRQLKQDEIAHQTDEASEWGLVMDVDFGVFERLLVYARGEGIDKRTVRRLSRFWQKDEVRVPVWKRLAMILKLRPHRRLPEKADTSSVYLRIFKNIPKADIDMLLPGARTRMSRVDKGKIGLPFLSGIGAALWNMADDVLRFLGQGFANPSLLFWGVATGAVGYGSKSYYNYVGTKQSYHLNLTQTLYFQNLDANAGVFHRLIDEAEEQECREAILAYFFLWRFPKDPGWLPRDLDDYIELELERTADLKVDFEIGDALEKLEKLRIVEKHGAHYRALPLPTALQTLDAIWDNYFTYNNNAVAAGATAGERGT